MFWKTFLLLFVILFCISFFIFGKEVGKIERLSGGVKIDAFGNDRFIEAVTGDILYTNTVLHFPEGSDAVILLREWRFEIISSSSSRLTVLDKENLPLFFIDRHIAIGDLLLITPDNKEMPNRYLIPVWQIVNEVIRNLFNNISIEYYRTREQPPYKDWDWMVDENTYKFKIVRDRFRDQDYEGALLLLLRIENPDKLELPCGAFEFLLGICYLKLEEYEKAKEQFSISEQVVKQREMEYQLSYFYDPLLYLSGILSYRTGDYMKASAYLQSYVENTRSENIEISIAVYSLFIDACIQTDRHEKAEEILTKAIAGCTNDLLKKELEKLLAYLYSYEANS